MIASWNPSSACAPGRMNSRLREHLFDLTVKWCRLDLVRLACRHLPLLLTNRRHPNELQHVPKEDGERAKRSPGNRGRPKTENPLHTDEQHKSEADRKRQQRCPRRAGYQTMNMTGVFTARDDPVP